MAADSGAGPKGKGKAKEHAAAIVDPRFARLHTDPRFLRPNREDGKVVLDERFKGLLKDVDLDAREGHRVKRDKYGRPQQRDRSRHTELQRLYRTEKGKQGHSGSDGSSDEEVKEQQPGRVIDYARGEGQLDSSSDDDSSEESEGDSDEEEEDVLIGPAVARRKEARRQGSDEEEDEEESEGSEVLEPPTLNASKDQLAELDAQAERAVQQEAKEAQKAKGKKQATPKYEGDTHRLAVVNMDWDHIRAIDLFKVFSSVVSPAGTSRAGPSSNRFSVKQDSMDRQIMPVQGRCLSVRVYPSEFGRKRMAKETLEGPPKEIFKTGEDDGSSKRKKRGKKEKRNDHDGSDDDTLLFEIDEGGDFDEEALRKYQLERLRYYYAIATFDSHQAARYIMDEIDGSEMEHTANTFDLSFVPNDMTFPDHQAPKDDPGNAGFRDEATDSHTDATYEGIDFTTDALRHSKVKLTWDADDPQRSKVTRQLAEKALTADQLRDDDFKAYLASASEESEEEQSEGDEAGKGRMRALLGLDGQTDSTAFGKTKSVAFADGRKTGRNGQPREGEMQITFLPGLSEAAERKKKGLSAPEEETTLEKYKRKQREKRERRKKQEPTDHEAQDMLLNGNSNDDVPMGFEDPFFSDGEPDFDAALEAEQHEKGGKKAGKPTKMVSENVDQGDEEERRRQLELVMDFNDEGEAGAGHFSLKDILKAEQMADGKKKKGRWAKKKEKKLAKLGEAGERGDNEVQPGFEIDVQDPRFQGLYGDHRFALDPSHPNYIKTKNTQRLVEERRKQDKKRQRKSTNGATALDIDRADERQVDGKSMMANEGADDDLSSLIQSVKKRAANGMPVRPSHKKTKQSA